MLYITDSTGPEKHGPTESAFRKHGLSTDTCMVGLPVMDSVLAGKVEFTTQLPVSFDAKLYYSGTSGGSPSYKICFFIFFRCTQNARNVCLMVSGDWRWYRNVDLIGTQNAKYLIVSSFKITRRIMSLCLLHYCLESKLYIKYIKYINSNIVFLPIVISM